VQHCYTSPIREFTNKFQDSLNFKEYYQDDRINQKKKEKGKISEMKWVKNVCPISGIVPKNMGQIVTLIKETYSDYEI
jgi:hypothetical protein